MKNLIYAALAVFVLSFAMLASASAQTTQAQTSQTQTAPPDTGAAFTSAISLNPISLIFGLFDASYEFKLSKNNSLVVFGSYWDIDAGYWAAFGIGASYRWYLDVSSVTKWNNKPMLEGFSVGPVASIGFWKWSGPSIIDPATGANLNPYNGGVSFQIGGSAAYKWVFGGGWFVEPEITIWIPVASPSGFAGFSDFGLGGNLGYAWH